jgi:sugar lactone lactonase YvrE
LDAFSATNPCAVHVRRLFAMVRNSRSSGVQHATLTASLDLTICIHAGSTAVSSFAMKPPLTSWIAIAVATFFMAGTGLAAQPEFRSIAVGATPECVVPGFDGKLYVTLMGEKRQKGDGDGKIVRVEGETVTVFAEGLDDPKGLVFVGGELITADFENIWAFDAKGTKRLLAGPNAFPEPPLYLNDLAVEPGKQSILVAEMGDVAAMHSAPGIFWPLDSDQAKQVKPRGRIYRVTLDGKVSIAIDHDERMPNPNGVDALTDGSIRIAEFFRGTLLEWRAGEWREIAHDHRSGDGVVHDDAGNIYLTEVRTGRIWHINAQTGEKRLLATLQSAADLYLDAANRQLIVPDSKAGLIVFVPTTE